MKAISLLVAAAAILNLVSCTSSPTVVMHAEDGSIIGRLRQLSESPPLYELWYEAPYNVVGPVTSVPPAGSIPGERLFACTCFSAIDASGSRVMGRNFDWLAHPILVLITRPAGGYASISVVDLSYVVSLADAPRWPFDGMNERGLAAGMMLVEEARSACELGMPSVSSFGIIRVILDEAATVDEAVALMDKYFVTFGDRPLHYFLADRTGASAVVEYYRGELRVFRAERPWQVAVNSLYSGTSESKRHAACWRYAVAADRLSETDGRLDAEGVFGLLAAVSEQCTVWSSSYDLTRTKLELALGRKFAEAYGWSLGDGE